MQRPPISTLFPYTTLFRSRQETAAALVNQGVAVWLAGDPERGGALDRKSTRLNSCHTVISYAVFCLKKKKKRDRAHLTGKFVRKQTAKSGSKKLHRKADDH